MTVSDALGDDVALAAEHVASAPNRPSGVGEATDYRVFRPRRAGPASVRTVRRLRIFVFRAEILKRWQAAIDAFLERLVGRGGVAVRVVVLGDAAPPPSCDEKAGVGGLYDTAAPTEIHVHRSQTGGTDPGLPAALLLQLADLDLHGAFCFTLTGESWPYVRRPNGGARLLFLFPGTIYPVSMGAHRRAVTMLAAFAERGIDVVALHTGPNRRASERARPLLRLFATDVVAYDNRRNWWANTRVRAYRRLYDVARLVARQRRSLPETFRERAPLRRNTALRRALRDLDPDSFEGILVNYAWMADAVLEAATTRPLLVCDTHDVQYYRAQSGQEWSWLDRRFFPPGADRRAEMERLARMDYVLCISERDAEHLRDALGADKALTAVSSFAYCYEPIRRRPAYAPLRFGFIGHRMPANARALALVLDAWWPRVRRHSPESELHIAGSICDDPDCRERVFLDDSVRPLGFVANLRGFFRDIDVLLSPVEVAGGINYKNVEALAAGVTVVTNSLGAEALRPLRLTHVVDQPDRLLEALEAIELDPDGEAAERERLQREVFALFHPDAAVGRVAEALASRPAS